MRRDLVRSHQQPRVTSPDKRESMHAPRFGSQSNSQASSPILSD